MKGDRERRVHIEVCECGELDRRQFLRSIGVTAAAVGAAALPLGRVIAAPAAAVVPAAAVDEAAKKPAETFVKLLFDSLTAEQRKVMHFPFDHEKRSYIANNWHIVDQETASIGKLYTPDQQELIRQVLRGVTSEEGYEKFQKSMQDDDGGLGNYTCAIFGEPGAEKFEFVLAGRHLTLRADGDSVENAAFGGPIFYGHAVKGTEEPDHPGNVWWHQARLANKVFGALDGKQREKALGDNAPADDAESIRFKEKGSELPGIALAELSADQKELFRATVKSLLSMYRESDVEEAIRCLEKNGGFDALRMSFYKEGDTGNDGIWDRWMVQGPAFAWYFRGSPHVHTWVNIGHRPPSAPRRATI